jgi:hypothetical protein
LTDVYVARDVLEGEAPLRLVAHDSEGDWQFLSGRGDDDLLHVPLERVLERVPEAGDFTDLERAWIAWREDVASDWVRQPQPRDDRG